MSRLLLSAGKKFRKFIFFTLCDLESSSTILETRVAQLDATYCKIFQSHSDHIVMLERN